MNEDRNDINNSFNDEYVPYNLRNKEQAAPVNGEEIQRAEAHIPQPVYYAEQRPQEETKRPAKRKRARNVFAALLIVALLAGTVGTMSLFYEIKPGDGDTVLMMTRRSTGTNTDADNGESAADLQNSDASGGTGTDATGVAGGPEMQINGIPSTATPSTLDAEKGGTLTIPEIAVKVTPSTVGVISSVRSAYGTSTSSGTGIIMTSDGYIITNNHVVSGATEISITLMDGKTYVGKLIGADERSDLAVVKIEASNLTPAEFGDSDALVVGDMVVAIGNPLGLELMGTVTDGIVSAINRDVVVEERTMTLIQTNAAINAGNSGGPLINEFGQVIGINTLKMQDYYTSVEGLGFAIPTNTAKAIVDELIENGYIKGRPAIGISGDTITAMEAKYYDVPQGMVVYYVNPKCDAYTQGLQVNDIITKAQGEDVESTEDLNIIKERYVAGDDFTVTVYREGKTLDITFKLMDEAEISTNEQSPFVP